MQWPPGPQPSAVHQCWSTPTGNSPLTRTGPYSAPSQLAQLPALNSLNSVPLRDRGSSRTEIRNRAVEMSQLLGEDCPRVGRMNGGAVPHHDSINAYRCRLLIGLHRPYHHKPIRDAGSPGHQFPPEGRPESSSNAATGLREIRPGFDPQTLRRLGRRKASNRMQCFPAAAASAKTGTKTIPPSFPRIQRPPSRVR